MAPGARNKFAAPMFEPKVFRKQMCCFEKSAYVIVSTFWPPPAVIWRPGNCASMPPSLRLRCYAIKIGKFTESKPIFKSKRHEHLQFSNTIRHGSCTEWQQRLLAAFQVSSCSFVSLLCLPHTFFSAWTCVCFANNKSFRTFNKLLF